MHISPLGMSTYLKMLHHGALAPLIATPSDTSVDMLIGIYCKNFVHSGIVVVISKTKLDNYFLDIPITNNTKII